MASQPTLGAVAVPALVSRTAIVVAASTALALGAATALTWWALSGSSQSGIRRGPFDFSRDTVPEVSDSDLALLARYRDTKDLRALRTQLVRWWKDVKRRVHVYRCIQEMAFLKPRISLHQAYEAVLQRVAQAQGAAAGSPDLQLRVADVGCCFGQDTRLMVLDGVPADSIWAIDLVPDYWEAGKQLWGDVPGGRIAGVHTLFGDMTAFPKTPSAVDLEREQLLGTFHFVSAMAVLHCLTQVGCERFLSRCLSMLVPGEGLLLGMCVGTLEQQGVTWAAVQAAPLGEEALHTRFLHSTASLKQTLEALGYVDVEVSVLERHVQRAQQEPSNTPNMQLLNFQARRP